MSSGIFFGSSGMDDCKTYPIIGIVDIFVNVLMQKAFVEFSILFVFADTRINLYHNTVYKFFFCFFKHEMVTVSHIFYIFVRPYT
ncbi:MAG TPA: hypothetical protein DEQ30_13805 [Porphyromonadaceae bacterium]|nr:hypothetical protein [Porphyromonadaceae bacterium]